VFESVAESAGAFGSRDDFQSLQNDVSAFERLRRSVADRMETLAGAKEVEVTRLRAALQSAQANTPTQPPKKIVVDDDAPVKKPVRRNRRLRRRPLLRPPIPRSAAEIDAGPIELGPERPKAHRRMFSNHINY